MLLLCIAYSENILEKLYVLPENPFNLCNDMYLWLVLLCLGFYCSQQQFCKDTKTQLDISKDNAKISAINADNRTVKIFFSQKFDFVTSICNNNIDSEDNNLARYQIFFRCCWGFEKI